MKQARHEVRKRGAKQSPKAYSGSGVKEEVMGGREITACAMPSARATHASHRARILGLGLSVGIAIAIGGCSYQSWPKDNDVYHSQIVIPDETKGGLFYIDEKTGKASPEVCDTYGDGQTVCREASFDKAPPVAQYRAELAKRQAEWDAGKKVREAQEAKIKEMAKIGKRPVYSEGVDGKQTITFLTDQEIQAKFHSKPWPPVGKDDRLPLPKGLQVRGQYKTVAR